MMYLDFTVNIFFRFRFFKGEHLLIRENNAFLRYFGG
jgi:hypothetical protein